MEIKVKKFRFGSYSQNIILEDKKIIDARCSCYWGQHNKDAWKEGKTLCKHIQGVILHLDLKTKKYGFDEQDRLVEVNNQRVKCPEWLKHAYKKAVSFTCEDCKKVFPEDQLEIHRIKQGYKGGTYIPRNCKILCNGCHKKYAEDW